jgi:hypothetical protein
MPKILLSSCRIESRARCFVDHAHKIAGDWKMIPASGVHFTIVTNWSSQQVDHAIGQTFFAMHDT